MRDEITHLLGDIGARRRTWLTIAHDALAMLSAGRFASMKTHYQLARLAARAERHDSFLAAYERARSAAAAASKPLDDEALLAALAQRANDQLIVRWLKRSKLKEVSDLGLAWRIARRLLAGPYKAIGRRWMERVLGRLAEGDEVLAAKLPRHSRTYRQARTGRTPNVFPRDLERAAQQGAADLVLEHVTAILARSRTGNELPLKLLIGYRRAQISALLARGDADKAQALIAKLLQRRGLSGLQRQQLLDVLATHNLCAAAVKVALQLATRREHSVFKRAVERGLRCARKLGDKQQAAALALAVKRSQISTDRQMRLAERLEREGFSELAVQTYDRIVTPRVTRYPYLVSYARALLDTGRVSQAGDVLRRAIDMQRRRASEFRAAASLLQQHGYFARSRSLLREAQELHPSNMKVRYDLLLARMRETDDEGLSAQIAAFLKRGPTSLQLKGLLNAARASNRLHLLRVASRSLVQVDRAVERFRLELAGIVGARKQVESSVRRLRERGRFHTHTPIRWLRAVGATRAARAMAEDVLASAQPSGGSSGRAERMRVLREAMNARLDVNSESEALGIARLFIGRALERQRAAVIASEELDRIGFSRAAAAVAKLAMTRSSIDPHSTCRQGVTLWHADKHGEAVALWRHAMGHLLVGDEGVEGRYRTPAIRCLERAWREAGQADDFAAFLVQLLDVQPTDATLWAMLLDIQTRAGRLSEAVQTLRRAHRHAKGMDTLRYMPYARRLQRDGGGLALAQWFADDEGLRADPWWLSFVVEVLLDHDKQVGAKAVAARRRIESVGRNAVELRGHLARMWAARGQPEKAVRWLGRSPFAQTGGTSWAVQSRTARAAAAVLLTVYRHSVPPARVKAPQLAAVDATALQRMLALFDSWRPRVSSVDAILVAGEMVSQGHPQLAKQLLRLRGGDATVTQPEHVQRQRLRVAVATAPRAELVTLAKKVVTASETGRSRRPPEVRETHLLRHLALAGRPGAALVVAGAIAAKGSPAAQAVGVQSSIDPARVGGTQFSELVRSYDPRVLERMQAGAPVASMVDALAGCEVAIAAGKLRLAQKWAVALAKRHDEPWRIWFALHKAAVSFADAQAAVDFLLRAERAGAPAGALSCARLWLRAAGDSATCIAGRPIAQLPAADLAALAVAAARDVKGTGDSKLIDALARAPVDKQLAWIGGLSSRQWLLDAADARRAKALVEKLLGAVEPAFRRDALVNQALDDLSAIGVGDVGRRLTAAILARRPNDRYARNNASYALYLSGGDAMTALQIAIPALRNRGGAEAHALLDTLAASMWATGDQRQARQLQRWALAATRPARGLHDPTAPEIDAGLPLVRLAEFELKAGRLRQARLLALLGLQRERLAAAYMLQSAHPDEYAASGLPAVSLMLKALSVPRRSRLLRAAGLHEGGTPITIARALTVIKATLRQSLPREESAQ